MSASPFVRHLCVLLTTDHVHSSPTVYVDPVLAHHDAPTDHPTLLAGFLRVLYTYRSTVDGSTVSIFVPNKSLVKSILVPPVSHVSSVPEYLYAMVQRQRTLPGHPDKLCAAPCLTHDFSTLSPDQRGSTSSPGSTPSPESLCKKFYRPLSLRVLN